MSALALLLGAVAQVAAPAALPRAAERRYRVELAGEVVGWAGLQIACAPAGCRSVWQSALRAPADAGGRVLTRRIELETGSDGLARRVRSGERDGRGEREQEDGPGPIPASLAETLLGALGDGERRCLDVREEASGRTGKACAVREGEWLEAEVLGVRERFRARPGEPPDEVLLPAQGMRFAADAAAGLPERAPRLFGVGVPSGPGPARRFCGLAPEPPAPPAPAGLPAGFPEGESCQEKTARWLGAAERAGLQGRHVVGVAHDGVSFVWHEWAEVRSGQGWFPVDPSFRQVPAAGPRFAVARFAPADRAARAQAGAAVLACWGSARVE